MSKRNQTQTPPARAPRLVPAGGAKARTNASGGMQHDEDLPNKPYDD